MTLTPEQFNLLATKEDLNNFYKKDEMDEKFTKLFNLLDTISKDLKDIKSDFAANLGAHE